MNVILRWGSGGRADPGFARSSIVDSAWRCYQLYGIRGTKIDHIARETKISRTTIYRYFQSRDEILAAVVKQAISDLIVAAERRVGSHVSFVDFLVGSLPRLVDMVRQSALFVIISREVKLPCVGWSEIFGVICDHLRPRYEAAKAAGELADNVEFEQLMDWVAHVAEAYIVMPSPLSGSDLQDLLQKFLAPVIARRPV